MLISKFDLYKTGWLDLVFDDRNKAYGAYQLRQENSRTMLKAMGITFSVIAVAAIVIGVVVKPVITHDLPIKIIPVMLPIVIQPPVTPPKTISHPHTVTPPAHAAAPTHAFIPLVITDKPTVTEPPKMKDLPGDIGPIDSKVPAGTGIDDGPAKVTPGGTGISPGNTPVDFRELAEMPEPFGGAAGWSKFLQKNLKYPEMAIDQRMSGKVWVSFIVEKDGSLSNIQVSRGAGFGMDQEAIRVLKLAHAWKPGIQNGQPVRVKYDLPINFILGDDSN